VLETCVDLAAFPNPYIIFCNTRVSAGAQRGDSGSPVFRLNNGNAAEVILLGVLWAGDGTTEFVYSPISQVKKDLGPLVVY